MTRALAWLGATATIWALPCLVWSQSPPVQPSKARDCGDDNGVDRCAAAKQQQVRALFQTPPIETFRDQNARVRRAFFVDGYGNDMPLVTFVRRPGEDPTVTVTVRVPEGVEERRLVQMTALVPETIWTKALSRSEHFHRTLAPEPPKLGPNGEAPFGPICLHSWVVTVEASDPGEGRTPAEIRRSTENACGDGLAVDYAFALAGWAVDLLPACAVLDPKQHRNQVSRLEACGRFTGDRLAAAAVMNKLRSAPFLSPDAQALAAKRIPFTINSRARLSWAGEEASGWQAADELWARRAARTSFHEHTLIGESESRVRVIGHLWSGVGQDAQIAPSEQVWVKEIGLHDWGLETWTVGASAPAKLPPR